MGLSPYMLGSKSQSQINILNNIVYHVYHQHGIFIIYYYYLSTWTRRFSLRLALSAL